MSRKFILSDGSKINSKGFKVLLTGGDLARFGQNPVMLYGHDIDKVIGRWEDIKIENNKLTATPVFDTKDTFAAEQERKVNDNFLRGASIGIIPIKFEWQKEEYVLVEWELLEASIVPIPSDAGAVVLFNDRHEKLDFKKLEFEKLSNNLFINKKTGKMEKNEIVLSQATIKSLNLQGEFTSREVELAVSEKDSEISRLKLELDKQRKAGIESFLSGAAKAGKITEAEKAHFLKLAETDFDSVKALVEARAEKATASLAAMTTNHSATTGREGWDYLKWMKDDPKGLSALKAENPKEFERLQATLKK
jgi:HK97 family phage prohead protease